MSEIRKILIVDDHAIVRQGLKGLLAEAFPGALVGEAQNAVEFYKHLRNPIWNLVILDINMPDGNGLELLKVLRQEHRYLPVLILSAHSEDQYAVRALKAGASGFLTKSSAPEQLVQAVHKVLSGGKYISPAQAERLASHLETGHDGPLHEALSDREFQVLRLIAAGKTPTEIADALSLSVKTISTFRTRILGKMKMRNSSQLTQYALQNGLLDED